MIEYKILSADSLSAFTGGDIVALMIYAPSGMESLVWADAWLKHDEKRRNCHGIELHNAFQLDKFQRYKPNKLAVLIIVYLHASREYLFAFLRAS